MAAGFGRGRFAAFGAAFFAAGFFAGLGAGPFFTAFFAGREVFLTLFFGAVFFFVAMLYLS